MPILHTLVLSYPDQKKIC